MNATATIWGLTPTALHDRFWASRGVQVVRPGEPSAIVPYAELYLLLPPGTLTIFRPAALLDAMAWLSPDLVAVRLVDKRKDRYAERVHSDSSGRFQRFERVYGEADARTIRVGLTSDPEIVQIWQAAPDATTAWRRMRKSLRPSARSAARLQARIFDSEDSEESTLFLREIIGRWRRPDTTINRIQAAGDGVWMMDEQSVNAPASARGPLWIGAGRELPSDRFAVGPAVLWDSPAARPTQSPVEWLQIEPIAESLATLKTPAISRRPFKRAFDILFSLLVLVATLPLYPLIALAVFLEDGRPIFFSHTRETIGGRRFGCLKFRSMRRDAEMIKAKLAGENKADGPQFFIPDDPRLTRVGRILRDFQLDELPQFLNVLKGDMSVVGPRPSPFKENQFCPPWREARLSVRPGVTGLWQIRRTRVAGADFQEWIKYDIEYVERESFFFDLWIIWKTVLLVLRKVTRS